MGDYWAVRDRDGGLLCVGSGPPGSMAQQLPPEGYEISAITAEEYIEALQTPPASDQ